MQAFLFLWLWKMINMVMRGLMLVLKLIPTLIMVFVIGTVVIFVCGLAASPELVGSLFYECMAAIPHLIHVKQEDARTRPHVCALGDAGALGPELRVLHCSDVNAGQLANMLKHLKTDLDQHKN